MDTTSHVVIGLGLGALAQLDPVVSSSAALTDAVIIGTVIGSNAPDLDYLYKLKSKSSYIRNHRGWSHSILALPLWSLAVSSFIYPFFTEGSFVHLFFWTLAAVMIHVGLDLLNVYGTQALRPFNNKWIALDALPLFDPYIILLHLAGFFLLLFYEPGSVFFIIYLLMLFYIISRIGVKLFIYKHLKYYFKKAIKIKIIPKISLSNWHVLIETDEDHLFGNYSLGKLTIEHTLPKKNDYPEIVEESLNQKHITEFLASTSFAYPFVFKKKNGYFVYWRDLRFRYNRFFPYFTVMYINLDLNEKKFYTGWIYSLKQYKKLVRSMENSSHDS